MREEVGTKEGKQKKRRRAGSVFKHANFCILYKVLRVKRGRRKRKGAHKEKRRRAGTVFLPPVEKTIILFFRRVANGVRR